MPEEKVYYQSKMGLLEIVATNNGLSKVNFLEENVTIPNLETTLRSSLEISNVFLKDCINQLTGYFEGSLQTFSLVLDLSGTDFEKRVWRELEKISFGETISYLTLAERLGNKKVIRAAGRANGKNPLPIIVPCHRVIGSDGSLIGYEGGLWRKDWLLKHEGSRQATLW